MITAVDTQLIIMLPKEHIYLNSPVVILHANVNNDDDIIFPSVLM